MRIEVNSSLDLRIGILEKAVEEPTLHYIPKKRWRKGLIILCKKEGK